MKQCFLIAISVLVMVGFCDDAEVVKVRGRGIGTNKMEALKDAYRDAVEQAVGLYVDAEQMVKNEDLVKDQILTQSNAYIEKYKIAKESTAENGLITITILADVRKRALTRKIRDVMPSNTIDLSGISKDLHAQIITDFKANDDALTIIRNELQNLQPLKQLMKVTLGAVKPVVESVKEDSSMVRLWYPIKVEVDASKYYKEFVPRWSHILDQIKLDSVKRLDLKNNQTYVTAYNAAVAEKFGTVRKNRIGVMTKCDEAFEPNHYCTYCCSDVLCSWGIALNEEYNGMTFLNTRILGKDYVLHGCIDPRFSCGESFQNNGRAVRRVFSTADQGYSDPWLHVQFDGDSAFYVGLVTSANGQVLTGRLYRIPMDCVNEIVGWQHETACGKRGGDEIRKTIQSVEYGLQFLDQSKNEVARQTFSLSNMEIMNFSCAMLEKMERKSGDHKYGYDYTGGTQLWLISPLIGGFAKSYVKWISVDIPKDDVAKIATASISVEE